ncbi:RNA-directed RNA polymerase [ssRNA phage Gerhypos.2_40]|uniref:RNA-directed RNA polymerase n=2 Tax=Leviviricetes TaxID=2842243 RepID=A0A8S5L457_9VIRU|nr:RNA-directed RNA polymerase [ssRNA phage Gerhypos.2_40]QDH89548.1 MAG: RNA-dependent RNA polymerase [Leviviridae sp.]DAD52196.1 TPA_asm: RNA-directed RNA polymerase [ssRNA phage Gerhypos.2_40]
MKSNVSDLVELATQVYIDACSMCTADVSDLRDLDTLRSRVKDEGLSFLTITLPSFCRDFERSLAVGYIDSTLFRNFRKNGLIPAFLQGITSHIFNRETGGFINEQERKSIHSSIVISTLVGAVRQICLTFKKVELDCTPKRVFQAMESFKEIERSFDTFSVQSDDLGIFDKVCHALWDAPMASISPMECIPRHGPGSTADKRSGNRKFVWLRWHERLEHYFPFVGNAYPLGIEPDSEEFKNVTLVSQDQEQPVKVTPVPKTLKGPRIIAVEPCCMQFAQQGIRDRIYSVLESSVLTAGHVNFTDQSINQKLAMSSSSTGRFATIDLSDASDRVPHDLAMRMFDRNPDLQAAIEASRSTSAEFPDGQVIGPLRKFASMGSALCFPVEAMYFYTVCVIARLRKHNLLPSPRNVKYVTREIFVYGDDIIVPSADADFVLVCLQKYNCKVNIHKTFVTGKFRESCGVDAYDGDEVTPTYLGTMPPENKRQPERLISWTATANLFYKKGYWRTAQFLFSKIESIIGPLPYVSERTSGLGRISYLGYRSIERWNAKLHRFEVKTMVPMPVYRKSRLEGYAALGASLSKLDGLRSPWAMRDNKHLEQFALHGAVTLKRRWVPVT